MGNHEYAVMGNDGRVVFDCNTLPSNGFIDAVKTKNIAKIKIMSRQDKANYADYVAGGPDVMVKYITGETELVHRRDLSRRFLHSNGRPIKFSILKNDTTYVVYNICEESYKVFKLPNNCIAKLPNGMMAHNGFYIVAKADENGQIVRDTLTVVSPKYFRKTFKIPMQPALRAYIGKKPKSDADNFTLFTKNRTANNNARNTVPRFNSSDLGMNPANINISSVNDSPEKKVWRPTINRQGNNNQQAANTNIKSTYKYRVTAKVVDMDGRMLGFAVQEIATGRSRNLKVNELTQLCMNKLVENVMIVRNQRGNMYLKGNGCSLERLPQVIA